MIVVEVLADETHPAFDWLLVVVCLLSALCNIAALMDRNIKDNTMGVIGRRILVCAICFIAARFSWVMIFDGHNLVLSSSTYGGIFFFMFGSLIAALSQLTETWYTRNTVPVPNFMETDRDATGPFHFQSQTSPHRRSS